MDLKGRHYWEARQGWVFAPSEVSYNQSNPQVTMTKRQGQPDQRSKDARLESLLKELGHTPISKLSAGAAGLAALRGWCREALASIHLTAVAAMLRRRIDPSLDELRAIGVPVDLLELFPLWKRGSRARFRPRSFDLEPAPVGSAEPIGSLRLQLTPSSESASLALILLRDLLRKMDPSVRIFMMVQPGANIEGLSALARSFHATAEGRVRFVEGLTSTIFSQDNALPARRAEGSPLLLLPREFLRGTTRAEDELTKETAAEMFGVEVLDSQLCWQAGNILCDGERYLIGVDTIVDNMVRFGLAAGEVEAIFSAELGRPVVVLGDLCSVRIDDRGEVAESGQAEYHIDLDVALLGKFGRKRKPRALVSDPVLGIELLPEVLAKSSLVSGHFVPPAAARELIEAEYIAFGAQRHEQLLGYADKLEELGYEVIGMPDMRISNAENLFSTINLDFGYCNVLPGSCRGDPALYYLPFGLPGLDGLAVRQFEKAGVSPIRVTSNSRVANSLMLLRGGLRCFCGRVT